MKVLYIIGAGKFGPNKIKDSTSIFFRHHFSGGKLCYSLQQVYSHFRDFFSFSPILWKNWCHTYLSFDSCQNFSVENNYLFLYRNNLLDDFCIHRAFPISILFYYTFHLISGIEFEITQWSIFCQKSTIEIIFKNELVKKCFAQYNDF